MLKHGLMAWYTLFNIHSIFYRIWQLLYFDWQLDFYALACRHVSHSNWTCNTFTHVFWRIIAFFFLFFLNARVAYIIVIIFQIFSSILQKKKNQPNLTKLVCKIADTRVLQGLYFIWAHHELEGWCVIILWNNIVCSFKIM